MEGFFVGRLTNTYGKKRKFIIRMSRVKLHSKQELLSAISTNREVIKSYGVNRLGIFGSFSKGTSTELSDVDLLVDFVPGKKTFDNFMDLSFFLEELFGRKVELVTPQSLSKFIGPYILKEVENVSL
ncbi:nucleotidyltransferase family protein [Sediminibacterium sp.]|uniref:nucleotidyltransferase family protein n=1 Tax=Sediminibacterium sp. TaxID=1917865 RepID=UPI003F715903